MYKISVGIALCVALILGLVSHWTHSFDAFKGEFVACAYVALACIARIGGLIEQGS